MVRLQHDHWLCAAIISVSIAGCAGGSDSSLQQAGGYGSGSGSDGGSGSGSGSDGGGGGSGSGGMTASAYSVVDLVADQPGAAPLVDPILVNAWGIATGEKGFWIAAEETGLVAIYDGNGRPSTEDYVSGTINLGTGITGVARNDSEDFRIKSASGGSCEPAAFIFANVNGTLIGFNDEVEALSGIVAVTTPGAVYTGVAIAGDHVLAADLVGKHIDVFDSSFRSVTCDTASGFVDPDLPDDYGPFNVMATADNVFVAYAAVDEEEGEEEHGPGLGIVSMFTPDGAFVRRIATGGDLNAPWGMAIAPDAFGLGAGALVVGNFGDGHLTAFDPATGDTIGALQDAAGAPLAIDGLWGLTFGDDVDAGRSDVLYFAAGPEDETHGLYGRIELSGPR